MLYRVTGADGSIHDVEAKSADYALAAVVDMALFGMSRPVPQGTPEQAAKTAAWARAGGKMRVEPMPQGRRRKR
jgi:hypothetical protein